jgi:hypothetical protein
MIIRSMIQRAESKLPEFLRERPISHSTATGRQAPTSPDYKTSVAYHGHASDG